MSLRNSTILVAEDQEDSRSFLRVLLEKEGYNVIEAKNGVEAVILAVQENPDLILTDLNIHQMSGIAAVKQIRQVEKLREVPILAMSGDGQQGIEFFLNIDHFGNGYIKYLTKPLNTDELIDQINRLLSLVLV